MRACSIICNNLIKLLNSDRIIWVAYPDSSIHGEPVPYIRGWYRSKANDHEPIAVNILFSEYIDCEYLSQNANLISELLVELRDPKSFIKLLEWLKENGLVFQELTIERLFNDDWTNDA